MNLQNLSHKIYNHALHGLWSSCLLDCDGVTKQKILLHKIQILSNYYSYVFEYELRCALYQSHYVIGLGLYHISVLQYYNDARPERLTQYYK